MRRGSVRSVTPFLEQPHGMSRAHRQSDHITGMISPLGWTTDDHITGIITPVGWTTDDHIIGMITVNTNNPRSCRRSRQPPGLLGNTAAAAATDSAGSKTGGRNPMSRTTPRAENASTRSMPRSWPNARSTKRGDRVTAIHSLLIAWLRAPGSGA